jgi:hypothetical protein
MIKFAGFAYGRQSWTIVILWPALKHGLKMTLALKNHKKRYRSVMKGAILR